MEIHNNEVGLFLHPCRSVRVVPEDIERKVVPENRLERSHGALIFERDVYRYYFEWLYGTHQTHTMGR